MQEAAGSDWPACLDEVAGVRAADHMIDMVRRRRRGEPLQYVLGRWQFRSLDLAVDRRVLIPRPETEVVVEVALEHLDRLGRPQPVAVDLGTGSGAIALAVATERPTTAVWATDESAAALEVARANLAGMGGQAATSVRMVEGSWWQALPDDLVRRVDLAVSNPPYISVGEMASLPSSVLDWEPRAALEAGPGGLEDIEAIIAGAPVWMSDGGYLVVEIAPHQGPAVRALAQAAGFPTAGLDIRQDLAGKDRVFVARMGYLRPRPVAPGPADPSAKR